MKEAWYQQVVAGSGQGDLVQTGVQLERQRQQLATMGQIIAAQKRALDAQGKIIKNRDEIIAMKNGVIVEFSASLKKLEETLRLAPEMIRNNWAQMSALLDEDDRRAQELVTQLKKSLTLIHLQERRIAELTERRKDHQTTEQEQEHADLGAPDVDEGVSPSGASNGE